MVQKERGQLKNLEGHQVSVALDDGSRIDDCTLVAVESGPSGQLWVHANGVDAFVPFSKVADVWEVGRG